MSARALIDKNVIQRLVIGLLLPLEADGVGVFAPHEDPPSPDDETPTSRWCRLNPVKLVSHPRNAGSPGTDLKRAVITVTVGISDDEQRSWPTRLAHTMTLVAAALDAAAAEHATSTHSVQFDGVDDDQRNAGEHNGQMIGVITATAVAQRTTGRTADLTPA